MMVLVGTENGTLFTKQLQGFKVAAGGHACLEPSMSV